MITLRKASKADIATIRHLAETIWYPTYRPYLDEAQIQYMLEWMYNAQELASQLDKGYLYYLASEDDVAVGFFCVAELDVEHHVFKLHKLYILPTIQGKGLGKLMVNKALTIARDGGAKSMVLNVNKNNAAVDFYKRMGFKIKESMILDVGNGFVMDDFVMEIEL